MTDQDVRTAFEVVGRCEEDSNETLAFRDLAGKAALNGIGKLEAVETVHRKVPLTKKGGTAQFSLSLAWKVQSTVPHLSPGGPELKKSSYSSQTTTVP